MEASGPRHSDSGAAPDTARLQPLLETTRGIPATAQYDHWRETTGTMLEHLGCGAPPEAGFRAEALTWRFGGFALMTAEIDGGRYRRNAAQARRDGIDHWTLTMARDGHRVFRSGDSVQLMRPGSVHLSSLDLPFETDRSQSAWLHLYLPRDAFPDIGAALDAARLRPVAGPMGLLLQDYLALLADRLPGLHAGEAAGAAAATRALLAAALAPTPDRMAMAAAPLRESQLARVRRLVRENLGAATLGPDRLCRLAGMSRSQLYRLFAPFGGVAAHIQAERLRAAHRALSDPADRRSVARIAEAVGLFDGSSFSRVFRRTYGCSPREMRLAALAGTAQPLPSVAQGRAPENISDLLRSL